MGDFCVVSIITQARLCHFVFKMFEHEPAARVLLEAKERANVV